MTHWQSPNFFAYFPANASGPAILGDLLSSGTVCKTCSGATSPACTELETHVLDWLVDMLGLPEKFKSTTTGGGVIQDTASSAVLTALLAGVGACHRLAEQRAGSPTGHLVAYASSQAHSSIEKAVKIAGLGRDNLRLIEVDPFFGMRPDALVQTDPSGSSGRFDAVLCVRQRGYNVVDRDRPSASDRPICQAEAFGYT